MPDKCRRGHPSTPENRYPSGGCRPCQQLRDSGVVTDDMRVFGEGRTCNNGHAVVGDNCRVRVYQGVTRYVCVICHDAAHERYRLREKQACVGAYGGCCNCCGESEIKFLTLDHVANDGASHRRSLSARGDNAGGGLTMYRLARKEGYPSKYQVLCFNCNLGKQHNKGVCPHVDH